MTSKRAYSYVRFSSPEQAEGDSLRRQTALTQAYCERKKVTLDDSLHLHDLGVSAFRGDNVKEGALAGFLEACKMNPPRVPRGSYLIVESLDRLSRDQIRPALQLFLQLQDHGITIVTLQPEREYSPDNADALALIEPLIVFARAHEESQMKSHRRKQSWKAARERARTGEQMRSTKGEKKFYQKRPAWLEITANGFRVKEEAAAIVQRIYALALEGYGQRRIAELFRREGVPVMGRTGKWSSVYIGKILRSPAAMGTYQPCKKVGKSSVPDGEPIPNYYPPVVSEKVWRDVQDALADRQGEFVEKGKHKGQFKKGGKASTFAGRKGEGEPNLFTTLLYDAASGLRMGLVHGMGPKEEGERKRYLYLCPTTETGQNGTGLRLDYPTFEAALLTAVKELRLAEIAGEEHPADDKSAETERLTGKLADLDAKIERTKVRARAAEGEEEESYLDMIREYHKDKRQVKERLAELEKQSTGQVPSDLDEAQALIALLGKCPPEEREELRGRLKNRVRRLVKEIWVLTWDETSSIRNAAVQIVFRTGKVRALLLSWNRFGKHRFVIGVSTVAGETGRERHLADKMLSQYRVDELTHEFWEGYKVTMSPAIRENVANMIRVRETRAAVEALRTSREANGEDGI